MFDVRTIDIERLGGSYKGLFGEIAFAGAFPHYLLTRFHPRSKYLPQLPLTEEQRRFVERNWYAIDSVSMLEPVIVEVKIWSRYSRRRGFKPRASHDSIALMAAARRIGLQPLLAFVTIRDDWKVDIIIKNWSDREVTPTDFRRYDRTPARIRD